jgi:hypothetical protein
VLWRTTFEPKGVYATVYEPYQFSGLAHQINDQPTLKQVLREAASMLNLSGRSFHRAAGLRR